MSAEVSVLLTAFRRPQWFAEQLAAVQSQTLTPSDIRVWHNGRHDIPGAADISVVRAQPNLGVWPRFLHAMEFTTEYVCIFDDDTIPGPGWLESCLRVHREYGGLVGAIGVRFGPQQRRRPLTRTGWKHATPHVEEADIIGHSWFLRRDWLPYYAIEPRHPANFTTCGEDYHLSVAIQKHLGLRSYTAPHPSNDRSAWGSLKGREYGKGGVALYRRKGEERKKQMVHDFYRASGWNLVCERDSR